MAEGARVAVGAVDDQTYGALMRRTPIVIIVAAAMALGAGIAGAGIYLTVTDETSPTSQVPAPEPSAEPAPADPYEVYLDLAPADAVNLSREDAQARAMLGCGQTWAPGTVDAALAEAYAELCADME
ncbi:hypothetical protein HCB17_18540 [Salinispora arenicola]|uniref:hypothetical protein n=2 Tax=Salinispora arenicola TaxID=168697 RepID=UPI000369BAAF|nr:hypothetical protein [Salinispora arenicola]NIL42922.1 hypothetical protein [Salinispora arenicola]NIL58786.1 hypothetical protein [Salinispora arenicola]NIL65003.1 hypothetical protein [Salinispora arenicola]